jgi:hypothetical protein
MPTKAIHIPNVNRQIVARLPLNIKRRVHSVGELVVPLIGAQIEGYFAKLKTCCIRQSGNTSDWVGDRDT